MKIKCRVPAIRKLLRQVGRRLFRLAENNENPRMRGNGELWLLRQLLRAHLQSAADRPFIAIDGGANRGNYSQQVLKIARELDCDVNVHAFEPSPSCVRILQTDFGTDPRVHIVGAALGEKSGEASLFTDKDGSSLASLVRRECLNFNEKETIKVPLIALSDYAIANGIGHVDLLKLDVEGGEISALRGLRSMLNPDFIDVIQFEYGGTTLDAGSTLRDIIKLCVESGYVCAKLFPVFLELRSYEPWMENFSFANYVALSPRWLRCQS